MLVSAEQVLAQLRRTGAYDAMRDEMLEAFTASEQGKEFERDVRAILRRLSEDPGVARANSRAEYLEQRLAERLQRNSGLERMEKDARNFWLTTDRRAALHKRVGQAIDGLGTAGVEAFGKRRGSDPEVPRPLELDPPPHTGRGRSHNFYRRGDTVAAFVPLADSLCNAPRYMCLNVDIAACDAEKNMYTVCGPDAAKSGQELWAVYWDQILAIKRPYEYTYRTGEQVYALFRDDYGTDSAISTEYFPGRVERIGSMSLAVRYDGGGIGHVYYDEAFAAGKVGFLRQMSEERRKKRAPDATIEYGGRPQPSFTGFWPEMALPQLSKYGRRVRFRPMPPLLLEHSPCEHPVQGHRPADPPQPEPENADGRASSDMDTDSSTESPPQQLPLQMPPPQMPLPQMPPRLVQELSERSRSQSSGRPPATNGSSLPGPSQRPVADEEGEIDATKSGEEGEVVEGAQPEARAPAVPLHSPSMQMPRRSPSRGPPGYGARRSRWDRGWSPRGERGYSRGQPAEPSPDHGYRRRRLSRSRSPRRRFRSPSRSPRRFSRSRSPRRYFRSPNRPGRYQDDYRPWPQSRSPAYPMPPGPPPGPGGWASPPRDRHLPMRPGNRYRH